MHGDLDARGGVIRMAAKIKLYMFTGSTPSLSARLMLEHKGLDYKRVHVMVGPHAFGMLGRGFQTMTVPALKVDGRRVQGSREISLALDEIAPHPPLFPADPQQRRAAADAERSGEDSKTLFGASSGAPHDATHKRFSASCATTTHSCAPPNGSPAASSRGSRLLATARPIAPGKMTSPRSGRALTTSTLGSPWAGWPAPS